MKMRNFIKAATSLSLSLLLLVSCSKPDKTVKNGFVDEDEEEGSDSESSEVIDDTSINFDPASYKDMDKYGYGGLWCNEYGPYVKIDIEEGTMKFITGEDFVIEKIEDGYIYVHWNDYDRDEFMIEGFQSWENFQKKIRCNYTSAANINWYDGPISRQGSLRFPIKLEGHTLSFLNTELIPDSDYVKLIPPVEKLITKYQFSDLLNPSNECSGTNPVFKVTGECTFEPLVGDELTYEIDNMTVTVTDPVNDESVLFYVLYRADQAILTSEYGGVWYMDDSVWLCDYYDVYEDSVWTINSDRFLVIEDADGETYEYEPTGTGGSLSYKMVEGNREYLISFDPHMYGSFCCKKSIGNDPFSVENHNVAMEGTFEYDLIKYRNEIRDGKRKNDIYLTNQYVWKKGNETVICDVDLNGYDIEEVWLPDFCSLSLQYQEHEEMFYNYYEVCLSSLIHIKKGPYYCAVTITEELTKTSAALDVDYIGVRMDDETTYGETISYDSCSLSDGTLTVTFTPRSKYDKFDVYVTDETTSSKVDKVFDLKAFLSTDPHDSPWGVNEFNSNDIVDLVDMEYYTSDKCYIDPKTGSAIFWVYTPSDFACFTYYINALYVDLDDINDHKVDVHLMNDIDLDGYTWCPIGETAGPYVGGEFYETSFAGTFYGNGYSIKNYYTDFSSCFFDSIDMFTVIGLTLDYPVMKGANIIVGIESCLFAGPSCGLGNFIDCHLNINSSDYDDEDELLFGENNIFIGYLDCTMTIDGEEVDLSYLPTESQFGGNMFDYSVYKRPDGTYKYNAQAEYEKFKEEYGL